jgi:putative hemolysin
VEHFLNIAATKGGFRARLSALPADLAAALELRRTVFRAGLTSDQDAFDEGCQHLLIEERATGQLMACARVMMLDSGADVGASYCAQSYGLQGLSDIKSPMLELGRFCTTPHPKATDILRSAWGRLTALVDEHDIGLIFGCSSFQGTDPQAFSASLSYLKSNHLGPRDMPIAPLSMTSFELPNRVSDPKVALQTMPPLLRSYLAMGGWVSDHGVIDHDLGTCHVFTALEVAKIPPARARALRAIAHNG